MKTFQLRYPRLVSSQLSNEKLMALERRLQASEHKAKALEKQNEKLKSSLAAKERDCKLYYDQYQNIAAEFEEFKSKVTNEAQIPKFNSTPKDEAEIEPAIIVFDTDTETVESHEETTLFTSSELFLEPATLDKPIPTANSTEIPTLGQLEESENPVETRIGPETTSLKTTFEQQILKTSLLKMQKSEKNNRPIAIARKRARSETYTKPVSSKKTCYTPNTADFKPTHFKCRLCSDKLFKKIDEYRKHVKQIHPERKHLCDMCPATDTVAANLKWHKRSVHALPYGSGYDCELCKISLKTSSGLKQHFHCYH